MSTDGLVRHDRATRRLRLEEGATALATQFDNVDDYIAALPPHARSVADSIRQTIRTAAPDAVETMSYQMPAFKWQGKSLIHFGAWKKHIGLYPLPAMDDGLARDVAPYRGTESTLRLPLDDVPFELVERVTAALLEQRRDGAL